jgi:hypothetical protein
MTAMRRLSSRAFPALALSILLTARARAGGDELPARLQVALLFKILAFDRNLPERVGDEIVLGIVYRSEIPESDALRHDLESALDEAEHPEIQRIPVRAVPIDLDHAMLEEALLRRSCDVLYIAPIGSTAVSRVCRTARAHGITTISAAPGYVEEGVALGLSVESGRPAITVNLPAARAEGADLGSQLLGLARVIE